MLNSKYIVKEFDYKLASQGALCAVVNDTAGIEDVFNPEDAGPDSDEWKGVGICRYKNYRFFITINSIEYVFDIRGAAVSDSAKDAAVKLLLAEADEEVSSAGTTVGVNKRKIITRNPSTGAITETEDTSQSSVMVDSMDARDTFALYALKTLMERADIDPLSCSENEMTWYCEAAYKWAAVMITQASKNKALLRTLESSTIPIAEGDLSTNTEKLLNNIANAIENGSGSGTDVSGIVSALKGSNDATVSAAVAGLGTTDNPFVISDGGGGGSTDVSGIVAALKASTDKTVSNAITDAKTVISGAIEDLSTINIGNSGLGRNTSNPVYTHDESVASAIAGLGTASNPLHISSSPGTDSVDTEQLVDGAVTHVKLDDDAVEANNIADGQINAEHLNSNLNQALCRNNSIIDLFNFIKADSNVIMYYTKSGDDYLFYRIPALPSNIPTITYIMYHGTINYHVVATGANLSFTNPVFYYAYETLYIAASSTAADSIWCYDERLSRFTAEELPPVSVASSCRQDIIAEVIGALEANGYSGINNGNRVEQIADIANNQIYYTTD